MAFMQIATEYGLWYKVEVRGETHYVPPGMVYLEGIDKGDTVTPDGNVEYEQLTVDHEDEDAMEAAKQAANDRYEEWLNALQPYVEPKMTLENVSEIEAWEGWGARYSAPGYIDCTDWCLGDTQEEAIAECKDLYGDDEDEEDEEDEPEDEEDGVIRCPDCGEEPTKTADGYHCTPCGLSMKANGSADIEDDTAEVSECQNCCQRFTQDMLKPIRDIHQRVGHGEPMPSGECPLCGSLCQPIDADKEAWVASKRPLIDGLDPDDGEDTDEDVKCRACKWTGPQSELQGGECPSCHCKSVEKV